MEFERIMVSTRDEYQRAQEPVRFLWRHQEFEIERVLDRWYEGYRDSTRMPLRYYRIRTRGGEQFVLRYHEFFNAWSILVPEEEGEQ